MSDGYVYPVGYYPSGHGSADPDGTFRPVQSIDSRCTSLARLAALGAVVGGAVAAAANVGRLQRGEIDLNEVVAHTAKTAVSSAVATAIGGAVAGVVAEQGLVRLGVMLATGTAVLYGVERWSTRGGQDLV